MTSPAPIRRFGFCLSVALLLSTGGCFDAEKLIEARRAVAIRARLEEIDLGEYRLTIPRPATSTEKAEIAFHAFGQVANRDLAAVAELLEKKEPELRHRLLMAARTLGMAELEDPKLAKLRLNIIEVINETLPGEPLQSAGFYSFVFTNY